MKYTSYYLDVAEAIAKRSKCVSLQVGCVLVKDDQIISTGINGTPETYTNCATEFEGCSKDYIKHYHHEWSSKYEIHAEMNAILRAGQSVKGAVAYCTHSPCFNCTKHLLAAGIKDIYYRNRYHRLTDNEYNDIVVFAHSNIAIYKGENEHELH